jgi:hypothetical protein
MTCLHHGAINHVMVPVDVIVSAAGGVLAALAGVLVGGALGSRSQTRQWFRDQQVQACADILRESTKILAEFEQASGKHRRVEVDWNPWNGSLATISIVAEREVIDSANRIDEFFWTTSVEIDDLKVTDKRWFELRGEAESRRLEFVNISRRVLGRSGPSIGQILGRPAWWTAEHR